MSKYEDQERVSEHYEKQILDEIKKTGKSETLDQILYEFCDKDDIREIYSELFEEDD